ncbi:MAG: esterase/lipase family protein [Solirubrobacteraceae bacterium]
MSSPPLQGELRFWPEFAGLVSDPRFWWPKRQTRQPVVLIPGFLAGDASLTVMAGWLRRRGHRVRTSGIRFNIGCAGRDLDRLDAVLTAFGEPVVLIGQSRGGTLARALAARHPDAVAALVTLGSPVLDPLAVSPSVLRTIRSVALLGDLGIPGLFSTECRDGDCCAEFRSLLSEPLPIGAPALALYSRSDAVVDWRACLDPHAKCVEIEGSHCGMAVNAQVYRELERLLE